MRVEDIKETSFDFNVCICRVYKFYMIATIFNTISIYIIWLSMIKPSHLSQELMELMHDPLFAKTCDDL